MPASRFFQGIAFSAHGTFGRIKGWCMDWQEGNVRECGGIDWFIQIAMDNGSCSNDLCAQSGCQLNRFAYGTASGNHIFHGQDTLRFSKGKTAAQLHPAINPLTEYSPRSKAGSGFLPDDNAPDGGCYYGIDPSVSGTAKFITNQIRQLASYLAGQVRVLKHEGTLEIDGTVAS